ncbi:carbohydrate ABC transporter permease [Pullulanibacillus pueri]|uniref:carbohydrate ABC transporter permease n=1 Tax=Pullulanibacillus pueri TaxID=1437324 RepID=UPI0035712BBE
MVNKVKKHSFDFIIIVLLLLIAATAVFPLLYVLSASLTPYSEVLKNGGFILLPKKFTLAAYNEILGQSKVIHAFGVTVFVTIVGTFINLILSLLMAFPLSRKNIPGRTFILFLVVLTLLVNGGIIPTYIVVHATGLTNTIWSMIVPNAIAAFNLLIMKSFFETLPEELFEAARMDGANEFYILYKIVLPLSIPVMMTIGLFYAAGHWNEFMQPLLYITDSSLFPLQVVIRDIIMQTQDQLNNPDVSIPTVTIQMASVIVASLPIILVYPFVQKYFMKGMLLGSIKG